MTASEFKEWLAGFRIGIGERAPTAEEWKLVCDKAAEVMDAAPIYPLAPIMPSPVLPCGSPWWEVAPPPAPIRGPIYTTMAHVVGSGCQPSPGMDGLMTWN